MKSPQEIFDTVASHLLKQRQKASENDGPWGGCWYRTTKGLKCAAGCLIEDSWYSTDMEGEGVESPKVKGAVGCPSWFAENLELIGNLQRVHDWQATSSWPSQLRGVAQKHDLSSAILVKEERM